MEGGGWGVGRGEQGVEVLGGGRGFVVEGMLPNVHIEARIRIELDRSMGGKRERRCRRGTIKHNERGQLLSWPLYQV